MRQLLNTLFVTTDGSYLSQDGNTVQVKVGGDTRARVPIHTLQGIVCFGRVSCSPHLMALCAENDVHISFLTVHGRFLARVVGKAHGNVLLRKEQYRRSAVPDEAAGVARSIVLGKIFNCRAVLLRGAREADDEMSASRLRDVSTKLKLISKSLVRPDPLDALRGREGEAARAYFGVFDDLILSRDGFRFVGRSRRPPLDPVNTMLSFAYTLLVHDVTAALESVGLDPAVGFLHRDRPGRGGLALDMAEEFRPVIADRLVLSLINRRQVKASGFEKTVTGAVTMNDATRRVVLQAYHDRKQEVIAHPFTGEKTAIGLLPFVQALLMSRYLRGDLDAYPPFAWR